METPEWLRTDEGQKEKAAPSRRHGPGARNERFIDKTLRHVLSFIEDSMFSEGISSKNGLLQKIEPRLKIITLLLFVVALSLQKSPGGIVNFLVLSFALVIASRISPYFFLKKLTPAAIITLCLSLPVVINLIVPGRPLLVLLHAERQMSIGPFVVPNEIEITEQGLKSAVTLLLRVLTSVSIVFLMIMTTRPNTFMKSVASLVPGPLSSVVSMSYRYIFLLVRKIEQFIMGLKSRQIAPVTSSGGRRWAASRIGLLFSISMGLSSELALSMESRGYHGEKIRTQASRLRITDIVWLAFTVLFCGVMIWKSSA